MLASHLRHAVLSLMLLAPLPAFAQKGAKPPAPAEAQDQARAKAKEGLRLFEAGLFDEALLTFREADALYHAPSITIFIARCQQKSGKLLEARATYEAILAEDLPKDASQPFVKAHVDAGKELAALKPRIPWLRVEVTGVTAGSAQMTLDGAALSGEKKDLNPGSYMLRVDAPGAPTAVRKIKLEEGGHEAVIIDMRAPAAPLDKPPPEAAPNRVPAIVALSVGGASAVAGAVLGGLALAQAGEVKSNCGGAPPCKPQGGLTKADLESQADSATAKAWGANIAIGVAVAGITTGVVLYVLKVPKASDAVKSALGPRGITVRF